MLMQVCPKPRPVLAPGWTFTTRSASTRASVIAHRSKFTRKACGYVDDRRCRPAALPPLPERARKGGESSPSPTYPQALQFNKTIDVDDSKSRGVPPATAPTMIGADIETGRATP